LDKDNLNANPVSIEARKRRIKNLKKWIVITVLILLLLPTFLCVIMFMKMSSLQKQVDLLMIEQYGVTYHDMKSKYNEHIAYAATIRKYDSTLEEIGNNEYNIDDRLNAVSKIAKNQEFLFLDSNVSPFKLDTKIDILRKSQVLKNDTLIKQLKNISINHNNTNKDGTKAIYTYDNLRDDQTKSQTVDNDLSTTKTSVKGKNKSDKEKSNKDKTVNDESNIDKSDKDKSDKDKSSKGKSSKDKTGENKSDKSNASKVDLPNTKDKSDNTDKSSTKTKDAKEVYLTFDDGPSKYTDDILDILNDYNVKATFFVIGKTDKQSKKIYQRIVDEGHTLAMHSYSHKYNSIYNSLEDFEKDFTKLQNLLYDTTGYFSTIFRFPGGSGNSVSKVDISVFIKFLCQQSVVYYDWNVDNGDATGKIYTPEQLSKNVLSGIENHDRSIVLMHDTDAKENTVKSLKLILDNLTNKNVSILPLQADVNPIQQVKVSSIEQKK
jgi:peptidoglycan-N-acetylglucosamine deacetylase